MTKVSEITSRAIADMIEYYKPVGGVIEEINAQLAAISNIVVSIEKYPRVAGETDDTNRINRAITDIYNGFGGGRIIFEPKVYEISNSITLMSKIELCGLGESTVIQASTSSPVFPFILMNNITEAKVRKMKLDGKASSRTLASASGGIFIDGSNHCLVEYVTLTDFGYQPISESGGNFITIEATEGENSCYRNTIKNCKLIDLDGRASFGIRLWTDWRHPIESNQYTSFVRDNLIENNYISGFDWNSIELAGPATVNNSIIGNRCENLYGYSFVEADKGSSYNLYAFNKCKNPTNRVPVAGFRNQGNPSENGLYGIFPERIAIGNQWLGNEVSGITQNDASNSSVSGMLFIRSKRSTVTNLNVRDVVANNASNNVSGIQFDALTEDISVTGGSLENVQTGIYMNGSNRVTIAGMNIKPIGYGYYATAATSADIVLTSNTFKDCTTAINMNAESNIQVLNNTISDSAGSVSVRFNNAKGSVIGNGIANTNPAHYGIDSRQANQLVANNRLMGCVLFNADGVRSSISNNFSDIDSKAGRVQTFSAVMPSSGSWYQGDYVTNKNIIVQGTSPNKYVVKGWIRITSGSNNVLNTDWVEDRALTGT